MGEEEAVFDDLDDSDDLDKGFLDCDDAEEACFEEPEVLVDDLEEEEACFKEAWDFSGVLDEEACLEEDRDFSDDLDAEAE